MTVTNFGVVANPATISTQDNTEMFGLVMGKAGETLVNELHGRFYTSTYRGVNFSVSNQAVVTTTAGLATTFTGLAVGNPAGSGVNLVFNKFTCTQTAVGVAGSVGIMGGVGTITASLTPQSRMIGAGLVSRALATAGQSISTPVLIATFGTLGSLATTGYGLQPAIVADLEGGIIVPQGSFVASYTTAATTSALVFGFSWEEVPV
jgi:hypothetical protein